MWFNIPATGYALSNGSLGTLVQTGPSTIRFNATGAQAGQVTLNLAPLSSAFPVNVVPGLLTHIEITDMNQVILTGTANLPTGQPYNFDVIGFDAFGNVATILPGFNTTGGIGSVSANNLTGAVFQAGSTVANGTIVVTLAGLSDSLAVTLYAPPQVTATAPASATLGIALNSTIGVSFSHVMNTSTITTNTTTACVGTIQVSADNFATCVPMASATPAFFASNTLAVITPAINLAGSTVYQIRITNAALDITGYPIAQIYTTVPGFTTVAGSSWIPTAYMQNPRLGHTETRLLNGKILITGGNVGVPNYMASCEIYDPASGTFTLTAPLAFIRGFHTATLLQNGKVLITGGTTGAQVLTHAEIYDPSTGTFSPTGAMNQKRAVHTATLLADGRVLISAGFEDPGSIYLNNAEIYDPATGIFTVTGSLATARRSHTATLLLNGKVAIIGGSNASGAVASTEIFDPSPGVESFGPTGSMAVGRYFHTATLLQNGSILIAGGHDGVNVLSTAEIFNPISETFSSTNPMATQRGAHAATLLLNGKVLISGGAGTSGINTNTAEIFDPAGIGSFAPTAAMAETRAFHTTTLLLDGRVVAIGAAALSEIYLP